MKFSEIPYKRPDKDAIIEEVGQITLRMQQAENYAQAKASFLDMDRLDRNISTQAVLAYIRHSVDTRVEFYDEEKKFWNSCIPEIQEHIQGFYRETAKSAFRKELADEYGDIVFKNIEISVRSFCPDNIPLMQEENDLVTEYEKLIASAQIDFKGGTYTIAQMTPFKNDPDDDVRLAAWKAEGQWYKDHQPDMDRIYDRLTHLRDEMGKKLGHADFVELGYDRMERNCYRKDDVEKFREAVRRYLVPVADQIRKDQAKRLGMQYPLSFSDMALEFRDGNPKPQGDAQHVLDAGRKFYDALSPQTSEFFRKMLDEEMMDVLAKPGKEGGGYCDGIPDYKMPFIFANFNGTQGDVEVVTHEAGHAFAYYMNRDRIPSTTSWPSLEACEVHSMSMEFFAWPWAEEFFGDDTEKYLYSHLAGALTFIPYGTMVDHFQHINYEKPDMTPKERHSVWKELLGIYMPWVRLDGEIPFYSEGEGWQRQHHIYTNPFYYIDYCLAQTVSLEFWAMIQEDLRSAWEKYMAYTQQGGSDTFTKLLEKAGLESPFVEDCLKKVSETAAKWLAEHRI